MKESLSHLVSVSTRWLPFLSLIIAFPAFAIDQGVLLAAQNMLNKGQPLQAFELLDPHEEEYAGDKDYDYLYGLSLLDTGEPAAAVFAFQRVLAVEPNFAGARLELGRSYFDMGQMQRAQREFVIVQNQSPPKAIREVIDKYIAAIESRNLKNRRGWRGFLQLGLGDDSNVNNATSASQFLGFELTDVEVSVSARARVEPARADVTTDDTLKAELKLGEVELAPEQIEQNNVFDQLASTESGSEISLIEGQISSSRMVATAVSLPDGSQTMAAVQSNAYSAAMLDSNNDLQAFENRALTDASVNGVYSTTQASIDLGYDPDTGIAWGRWGAGLAQFQGSDTTLSILHWVVSPDQAQNIALPSSGNVDYQWSGNTTPTDNQGNSGILGNASLQADFTNMNVDVGVAVSIPATGQVWNGSGTDLPISANGGFSGNLSSVTVNTGTAVIDGSGSAAGFFY